MKKLFSTSLLAMLCCFVNSSFAQNDSISRNTKSQWGHSNFQIPKFDIEEDLRLMTLLTNALEKEGFINTKKPYKLEIKDGEFFINDKIQSKEITERFSKYFRADKTDNYTIINNGDETETRANFDDAPKANPKAFASPDSKTMWFDGDKYKKDLRLMNQLISGLEKDGLLDTEKPYKLEVKTGELYINGKKQPAEVTAKFRKYFQSNNYALLND